MQCYLLNMQNSNTLLLSSSKCTVINIACQVHPSGHNASVVNGDLLFKKNSVQQPSCFLAVNLTAHKWSDDFMISWHTDDAVLQQNKLKVNYKKLYCCNVLFHWYNDLGLILRLRMTILSFSLILLLLRMQTQTLYIFLYF